MQKQDSLFEWVDGRAQFRGLPVERHTVTVTGAGSPPVCRTFKIAGIEDAADLLDQPDFAERFLKEDIAPYGMELWPAARMLAERILSGEDGGGRSAIELGCGLGLVSIAAAVRGWRVLATDNDPASLRFAEYNAGQNGAEMAGFEFLDWRHPPEGRRFERVFAADVLYQLVDHALILACIDRLLSPGGVALVVDPNRGVADRFEAMARADGFAVEVEAVGTLDSREKPICGRIFTLRHQA